MWLFLPLLITGQALSYPAPPLLDQIQNINTIRGINENFLNKLSMEAAWAYGQIIGNTSQSLNSIRTALTDWSKQYGIQKEYQLFADEIEKENENFKKSVKDLMPKLTKYFDDYMKVVNDKKQSVASAFNRTADLAKQLDDKQKAIAEYIMRVYLPSLADVPGINDNSGGGFPGSNSGFPGNRGVFPGGNTGYPWGNSGGLGGFAGGSSGIPGGVGSSWGNDLYPRNNNGYPGGNVGFSGTSGMLPGSNEGSGRFSGSRPGFPANNIGALERNGPFSSSTGDLQRRNDGFQGGRGGLFGGNDILLKNDGSFPRTYGSVNSNGASFGIPTTQQFGYNEGIPRAQVGDHGLSGALSGNNGFLGDRSTYIADGNPVSGKRYGELSNSGAQSGLNPKKPMFGQVNSFRQW
ncbi:unnamed protein product [Haemonchus placei]|uniref:DUF148 domain-containing protein n=1 Tax=Haemonchus placei TaxID=6290 RepID=A0A158QMT4_HAEPC|nr:unnamed protein product [Haemonchus placei]